MSISTTDMAHRSGRTIYPLREYVNRLDERVCVSSRHQLTVWLRSTYAKAADTERIETQKHSFGTSHITVLKSEDPGKPYSR